MDSYSQVLAAVQRMRGEPEPPDTVEKYLAIYELRELIASAEAKENEQ